MSEISELVRDALKEVNRMSFKQLSEDMADSMARSEALLRLADQKAVKPDVTVDAPEDAG